MRSKDRSYRQHLRGRNGPRGVGALGRVGVKMWRRILLTVPLLLGLLLGVLPAKPSVAAPSVATAVGSRLLGPDGHNLFLLGANYVGGPDRSWTMWQDDLFDQNLVDQHFARVKDAGLNTVRIFVRQPLPQLLLSGTWSRLDAVVGMAEKYGLYLIITLYDYREDDLSKVTEIDRAIAARYAATSAVLAYDLKNEPHYQDLAIAQYGSPPPLQTDVLIKQYGEVMKPAEVAAWRQNGAGKSLIPARFSDQEAYIYANNYTLYQKFVADAGNWVVARNYTVSDLDYLASPDSAKWRPLINALDATLAAWLAPQVAAVRAGDPRRLLTVGYSDAVLSSLPANNTLGFISVHRFPNVGLAPLRAALDLVGDLGRAFPDKPVAMEEFGYASTDVDPTRGAIYETAFLLRSLSQGMAGGAKWSLYDVANGSDSRENSFGLYRTDGTAKPMVGAFRALGDYAAASALPTGNLTVEADAAGGGIRYVYTAPDALFAAGQTYADAKGRLSFEAGTLAQVFVAWPRAGRIDVTSTATATVRLDPAALVGQAGVRDLALQRADGTTVPFRRQGNLVVFSAEAGQAYHLNYSLAAADARIEIVYPHDGKPVSQASLANIGAYLFEQGSSKALCTTSTPVVRLWRSLNNGVEEQIAVGVKRTATVEGLSFPEWDFNDVDVSAAKDPQNKYYFRLTVDGQPSRSSIWSHGADARTILPQQELPTSVASALPAVVDAKIEIVYPHDGKPVTQASLANIGAYLFAHGTRQSVPAEWSGVVRLWRALNNGYEEQVAIGQKVIKREGGLVYPSWQFNDVDVSAAKDPLNKYYFRVSVDGVDSRANIWSHGADARTYFPHMDVPSAVATCN